MHNHITIDSKGRLCVTTSYIVKHLSLQILEWTKPIFFAKQ